MAAAEQDGGGAGCQLQPVSVRSLTNFYPDVNMVAGGLAWPGGKIR